MPTAFDDALREVKGLAADFKANETYYLSPQFYELYGLSNEEIKIVEGEK